MNKVNKVLLGMASCVLFLTLTVLGFSINIETKPVSVNAAANQVEYAITGINNARETQCGYNTGSLAGSCPAPAGGGYTLVDSECLQNGGIGRCLSRICLWEKPSTQNFDYKMTHEGLSGATCPSQLPNNTNCADNPPAGGYALNKRYCSKSDPINGGCISDVCLWQKPNTTNTTTSLRFSHDGDQVNNVSTQIQTAHVDCRNIIPSGYPTLNSRVGIASYDKNTYSDLCLWQKSETVGAACTQNSDCGTNSFTGSLTCQNNDVWQNYRTYTCNNPGTQSASCSHSDELKLKQMCAAAQACDTGGCYPETW